MTDHEHNVVAVFSRGIASTPNIQTLLGARSVWLRPHDRDAHRVDAVVGWGNKRNTAVAQDYARRNELPYLRAEDGFLRSVGLGVSGDPPLSVVVDELGIYYDARTPSRLEQLLQDGAALGDPELLTRAERAMGLIRRARLSKYNDSPAGEPALGVRDRPRVLVVDQTFGDMSVSCGLAGPESFRAMLDAAIAENPDAEIIVKTHPDVLAGAKRGYLEHGRPGVRIFAEPVNPIALLEQVDRVYVVTSQLGFEALVCGKEVVCFGVPFYAGWGLTDDRCEVPRRTARRTLAELFVAACILYPRYVDPDTGEQCEIERVIEHLALQREMFEKNAGTIFCFGFRFWKQNYVRAYLRSPGNAIRFPRSAAHAERLGFGPDSKLVVWGQRETDEVRQLAARHQVDVWRMEDGFIRSVGLGSDLVTPASLVVDRVGIYYDPSRPSELEQILETAELSEDELSRARSLREALISSRLSKYNVGRAGALSVPDGRRVILVPGQVEDDASIRLGCVDVRTNLALLGAARSDHPDGYVIFKPHPDVLSGNRAGAVALDEARRLCDHVELDASLPDCLAAADEVQTMTSLVGFEGLLRGLDVVTYGQPFYAGWGVSDDRAPITRRHRRRTLDELVACALIRYPRYLNRATRRFTTPEMVISQLREERDGADTVRALHVSWPRRQLRKLVHVYREVTSAP